MLGFLPEKVYTRVKDDPAYIAYEAKINDAVNADCLVQRIVNEESIDSTTLKAERDAVTNRLCTEEEIRSIVIMETNDEAVLKTMLETETDAENTMLIYQQLIGVCYFTSNPKAGPFMDEFILLCENIDNDFCEKVWEEYFTFVCFKKITDIFKQKAYNPNGFDELKEVMEQKGEEVMARFDNSEYINDIVNHIKTKMTFYYFGYLLDYYGVILPVEMMIENKIVPYVESISFKYSDFNLFKLRIYDNVAKYHFDTRSRKYFAALKKVIDLINQGMTPENRANTVKAVNYYNDRLGFELLNIISMYRKITIELMPAYKYKVNVDQLTAAEKAVTATTDGSVSLIKEQYGLSGIVNDVIDRLCNKQASFINAYLTGNEEHYQYMQTLYQISL